MMHLHIILSVWLVVFIVFAALFADLRRLTR